jgi:hypothetical protein
MYDHVVMISIDTLRSDVISSNPLKLWDKKHPTLSQPDTGVLDALIGEGFFFANCVSAAPYTSSSHASFLTGRWPLNHGVYEFYNRKLRQETLLSRAARLGFKTVLKSDFPVILGPTLGFDRGVHEFIVEDDDRFLESIRGEKKTFSLVHFGGCHVPYGFHNTKYGGEAYRAKLEALEREIGASTKLPKDQLFETYRDDEDFRNLMRYKRAVQELWKASQPDRIFALYLEGVEHFLQTRFAAFMERLRGVLQGKRWLLVLFGDHGEEYDEESFGHFNTVTEGVMRVPLLFVADDLPRRMYRGRVRAVDVYQTISDLMGPSAGFRKTNDGTSLASVITASATLPDLDNYAQTYVADTASFIKFQKRVMTRGGVKSGNLPHLLYKEAIWKEGLKLTRYTAEFSEYLGGLMEITPREKLERFDEWAVPGEISSPATRKKLAAALKAYNQRKSRGMAA